VGGFALHELRYLAGDPSHGYGALSSDVHSYVPLLAALVLLLFAASVAHFVSSLMLARGGELRQPRPLSFRRAWPWATAALLAMFVTQESLEGALLVGHSSGVHGLFGHAGWAVFVFAPLIAAVIALALRTTQSILIAAVRSLHRATPRPARGRWQLPPPTAAPSLDVLACHLAGRAPPRLS
jgi:hypothetical protein